MSTTQDATSIKAPLSGLDAGSAASQAADPASAAVSGAANSAASAPAATGDALGGAVSTLGQTDSLFTWGSYFQALAILFLIVAVLFVALWFLKRRGGIKLLTRQGNLFLESRLALGPKKSLVVVRFLNKRVLLGVTDQQITMLTELPTDEDATAHLGPDTPGAADFKAHFDRAAQNAPENPG
ncbi:putative flagellar biosynthesis protein, FliO [uncultured delta proteobacterium]|uniref:Flagellar protein n=1 Tax=uncultured delta proteobacterium TaxID=34034 RepID=A0A212J5V4_9DELT|nr:putative flagellar biosynthesis protein, FliO [uncultured delta proteobacterium]